VGGRREPSARSGGPSTWRSSPTRSIEDSGSHQGPCGGWQGWVWVGDEGASSKEINEVARYGWCTIDFGSPSNGGGGDSPSLATRWVRPGRVEVVCW
jgi:hypothetical protein